MMEINVYGEVHVYTKEHEQVSVKSSVEMNLLKQKIKRRDDNCCQVCGERDKPLEVHHIFPKARYPSMMGDSSNLITLCQSCHRKYHDAFTGSEGAVSFSKYMKNNGKL